MKHNILLTALTFVFLLFSCNKKENVETEPQISLVKVSQLLPQEMIGLWNTQQLNIVLNVNTDSSQNIKIPISQFPEKLKITTVQAKYFANGSFISVAIDTLGKEMEKEEGTWYKKGDSLIVDYNAQHFTYAYEYKEAESKGTFKTYVDWDMDGLKDDYLELTSIKIRD